MSNILVIDTSTDAVAVACGTSNKDATSRCVAQQAFHSENILVSIDEVLSERSLTMADLDGIGVGIGPGLFTGLRVGISAAHAFVHALEIPLVYFSSLELTARSSMEKNSSSASEIIVARDARRHELYSATYSLPITRAKMCTVDTTTVSTSLTRVTEESLVSPQDLVSTVNTSAADVFLDGSKYEEFAGFSENAQKRIASTTIDARYMIDLVIESIEEDIVADPFAPSALYIRKSDAELSWGVS